MKIFKTFAVGLAVFGLSATAYAQSVTVVMKDGTQKKFAADYVTEMNFDKVSGPSVINCNFDNVDVSVFSNGNYTVKVTDTATGNQLELDLYSGYSASYLLPGDYMGGVTKTPYMDFKYSSATINGEKLDVTEGHVNVSLEGEVYTISPEVTLANGSTVSGTYKGELNAGGPSLKLVMSAAKYLDNPQRHGEFYVKFNDADWHCEMAIDFQGNKGDHSLMPGVYTFSNTNTAPMTFSEKSYLDTYNPSSSNRFLEGSTVEVALDDVNYTITMKLLLQDGRLANVTYVGTISGAPLFN